MSPHRSLPPLRILVALGVTAVAVVVLGVGALTGDDAPTDRPRSDATTTTSEAPTTVATVDTSVVVAPDWYPKESSRYSDRRPAVTITTLPSTSTSTSTSAPGEGTSEGDSTGGDSTDGG